MGGCDTPPTFGIFVGKFNSVEFRRYMADVLSQAVFKCVEIALYSINTCDTLGKTVNDPQRLYGYQALRLVFICCNSSAMVADLGLRLSPMNYNI